MHFALLVICSTYAAHAIGHGNASSVRRKSTHQNESDLPTSDNDHGNQLSNSDPHVQEESYINSDKNCNLSTEQVPRSESENDASASLSSTAPFSFTIGEEEVNAGDNTDLNLKIFAEIALSSTERHGSKASSDFSSQPDSESMNCFKNHSEQIRSQSEKLAEGIIETLRVLFLSNPQSNGSIELQFSQKLPECAFCHGSFKKRLNEYDLCRAPTRSNAGAITYVGNSIFIPLLDTKMCHTQCFIDKLHGNWHIGANNKCYQQEIAVFLRVCAEICMANEHVRRTAGWGPSEHALLNVLRKVHDAPISNESVRLGIAEDKPPLILPPLVCVYLELMCIHILQQIGPHAPSLLNNLIATDRVWRWIARCMPSNNSRFQLLPLMPPSNPWCLPLSRAGILGLRPTIRNTTDNSEDAISRRTSDLNDSLADWICETLRMATFDNCKILQWVHLMMSAFHLDSTIIARILEREGLTGRIPILIGAYLFSTKEPVCDQFKNALFECLEVYPEYTPLLLLPKGSLPFKQVISFLSRVASIYSNNQGCNYNAGLAFSILPRCYFLSIEGLRSLLILYQGTPRTIFPNTILWRVVHNAFRMLPARCQKDSSDMNSSRDENYGEDAAGSQTYNCFSGQKGCDRPVNTPTYQPKRGRLSQQGEYYFMNQQNQYNAPSTPSSAQLPRNHRMMHLDKELLTERDDRNTSTSDLDEAYIPMFADAPLIALSVEKARWQSAVERIPLADSCTVENLYTFLVELVQKSPPINSTSLDHLYNCTRDWHLRDILTFIEMELQNPMRPLGRHLFRLAPPENFRGVFMRYLLHVRLEDYDFDALISSELYRELSGDDINKVVTSLLHSTCDGYAERAVRAVKSCYIPALFTISMPTWMLLDEVSTNSLLFYKHIVMPLPCNSLYGDPALYLEEYTEAINSGRLPESFYEKSSFLKYILAKI